MLQFSGRSKVLGEEGIRKEILGYTPDVLYLA